MGWREMFRPGMRAYIIPLTAGTALATSAFLPWVVVSSPAGGSASQVALSGVPDAAGLWVAGLGVAAAVLATLSLITRKNSRHPLLLVGLVGLGIMFLSWRITPQTVATRARIREQAVAIVEHSEPGAPPAVRVGSGIYLGLAASFAIAAFGMTIVIKRVSHTYALTDPDDDVE